MQTAKHGDRRDQQRNEIGFRRFPLVSSRAGQAIGTPEAQKRANQGNSRSRAIPGSCLHSVRRLKSGAVTPAEYRRRRHEHLRTDFVSHASAAGSIRSQHTYDLIASKP